MFTKQQKCVVAALFARSNMGLNRPTAAELRPLLEAATRERHARSLNLNWAVVSLCQQFMETDEDEDTFMDEARMWLRDEKLASLDEITKVWPDMAALLTAALAAATPSAQG
jgi:hypothetical protein